MLPLKYKGTGRIIIKGIALWNCTLSSKGGGEQ